MVPLIILYNRQLQNPFVLLTLSLQQIILIISVKKKTRTDFSMRAFYFLSDINFSIHFRKHAVGRFYNDSNPVFQEFFPTIPSTVNPWFFCQVFVMFSVPLPKLPSAVVPMMICHTLTDFPLLPFLIVFIL